MSQENVSLVLAFYAAYNAREPDAAVDLCTANVAVFPDASVFPIGGVSGRDEFLAYMEETWSRWESCSGKTEEVHDLGDGRVLVRGDGGGVGIASGAESYRSLSTIFTVRDGQISKLAHFFSHAKALEAVGLSE